MSTQAIAATPVAASGDGQKMIDHIVEVMDGLLAAIQEETELVRAGKLTEAAKLDPSKSELSRIYLDAAALIRANQARLEQLVPGRIEELRNRHNEFRALLQINLTVLATAHAVSESIMRGVSAELARKATPQAYGSTGRATTPSAAGRQPLTLSRVL